MEIAFDHNNYIKHMFYYVDIFIIEYGIKCIQGNT